MHNPYTPPAAQVGDIDVPQGSRLKAILAGLAVDLGGSILFGVAFIAKGKGKGKGDGGIKK